MTLDRSWTRRFTRWWTDDLPPMTGPLRLSYCLGILAFGLAFPSSPFRFLPAYADLGPSLRTPPWLIRTLGLADVSVGALEAVRVAAIVALAMAAIGLVTRPALLAASILMALLHGISRGCLSINHTWYVAVFALLFLNLSAYRDRWSLDALLAERLGWWPDFSASRSPLLHTGLARKLVLVAAVHTFASAGVAKILDQGDFSWADGLSLARYIGLTKPRWPGLAEQLTSSPVLARLASTGSLLFELLSPLALAGRRPRHLFVLMACAFHIAVFSVMVPAFWVQMWCYVLVVDWRSLLGRARRPIEVSPAAWRARERGAAVATAVAALLVVVALERIEAWPLTHVPMYSSYLGQGKISRWREADFGNRTSFASRVRCGEPIEWPWSPVGFEDRYEVVAKGPGVQMSLGKVIQTKSPQQWRQVNRMAAKTELEFLFCGTRSAVEGGLVTGAQLLREYAVRARRQGIALDAYDRIELTYRFETGPLVLSAIGLSVAEVSSSPWHDDDQLMIGGRARRRRDATRVQIK